MESILETSAGGFSVVLERTIRTTEPLRARGDLMETIGNSSVCKRGAGLDRAASVQGRQVGENGSMAECDPVLACCTCRDDLMVNCSGVGAPRGVQNGHRERDPEGIPALMCPVRCPCGSGPRRERPLACSDSPEGATNPSVAVWRRTDC